MVTEAEDNELEQMPEEGMDETSGHVVWQRIVVRHASVWRPPTDVYKTEDGLVILVEVAGMSGSDFEIVLHNQKLVIGGVRQNLVKPENVAYHQLEIQRGNFRTEVHIPWRVNRELVTATYRDGFLRIELPKVASRPIHVMSVRTQEEA
jgi:HSP20 family protein